MSGGQPKERERRSLRQILSAPGTRKALRIIGLVLSALSAVWLILLTLAVILQPADRAFTRPEEWLVLALLALPAVLILAAFLILRLRRRQTTNPKDKRA